MNVSIPTRVAQFVAAAILIFAAVMKFKGDPGAVFIFSELEMEPGGRYIAAVFEMIAGLLLTPLASAWKSTTTAAHWSFNWLRCC